MDTSTDAPTTPTTADDQPLLVDVPAELEPERPPLVDADGRVRLSFSRVDTYDNCPRKFRYRYVDRLPSRPAPALSFGTSVHGALERFYDRKLPQEPSEDELLGFLYEEWEQVGFVELDRAEQLAYYRQAQDVLRRYHRRVTGRYRLPVATEAWFDLPIGERATVVGSIDRVDADDDGALRVVDYKTNKRVRDRSRVAGSLQLSLYALACEHLYGDLPASVALDFLVPGVMVEVALEDLDLDRARRVVDETAQAVLAQEYPTTPNRLCDWCDFRAVCPAWEERDDGATLGGAVLEVEQRRRRLTRDVADLRALEAGVQRLQDELADDEVAAGDAHAAARRDDGSGPAGTGDDEG